MKRLMLVVAGLALLQACQDTTSPPETVSPAAAVVPDLGVGALTQHAATFPQLWAVVRFNGTIALSSGVLGITHFGPGRYEVRFNRNVRTCAYVATTRQTYSQALLVFTASGHLTLNGVYVETKNQGGGLMDGNFNLVVTCGVPQNIRGAVVGYTANLVRASPGTLLSSPGPGRYFVRFASSVATCAFIATVGDPANGLVFNPSGVYTGSTRDPSTVYVETKNIGGGLQAGVPFHLAIVCPATPVSRFAVVRAIGSAQRASPFTSSVRPSTGRYLVVTNRVLTTCAAVATRGSVNTLVPFTPATVEIVPGAGVNTAGFQVRRLLFFGGLRTNQDFHAAILC